jgi:hypothetical protein
MTKMLILVHHGKRWLWGVPLLVLLCLTHAAKADYRWSGSSLATKTSLVGGAWDISSLDGNGPSYVAWINGTTTNAILGGTGTGPIRINVALFPSPRTPWDLPALRKNILSTLRLEELLAVHRTGTAGTLRQRLPLHSGAQDTHDDSDHLARLLYRLAPASDLAPAGLVRQPLPPQNQ